MYVGIGDVLDIFFKAHLIAGRAILQEIDNKLIAYYTVRQIGEDRGFFTQADITYLEDELMRGGRSAQSVGIRNLIGIGVVLLILYNLFW